MNNEAPDKNFKLKQGLLFLIILVAISASAYFIAKAKLKDGGQKRIGEAAQCDEKTGRCSLSGKKGDMASASEKKICTDCVRRRIDGAYVEKGKDNLFPFAAMIENHVDARPLSGLSKANLVYEAEAEGGITRFLAVFASDEKVNEIGPVRSARAYYVDWAHEFSSLYVHCGGSPEALAKIISERIFDFNEFYKGAYFWRDRSKPAPHNVFTSSENIGKYLKAKGKKEGNFDSWLYKEDIPFEERPATSSVLIYFRKPEFVAEWEYDKEKNDYTRNYPKIGKYKTGDRDGSEIRAKNIAIEYVKSWVEDEKSRLGMVNIGQGKAIICFDGQCQPGRWEKKTALSRTRFYDNINTEIKFNAGTTWIEVIKPEYKVTY